MYARMTPERYPRDMRVPENYSGNTFRSPRETYPAQPVAPLPEQAPQDSERMRPETSADFPPWRDSRHSFPEESAVPEVPENTEPSPDIRKEEVSPQSQSQSREAPSHAEPAGITKMSSGIGGLFGRLGSGNIGLEELMILALILLVSQDKDSDDLIFFLLLLLFIQ